MLFDAPGWFQILSNFFRCFQRHGQESWRFFQIFQFHSDRFRSLQIPANSSKFFQFFRCSSNFLNSSKFLKIRSDSHKLPQIPSNSFRISQFLSNSLKFPQIPPDSFKLLHFLSDSLLQIISIFLILSDYSGCFSIFPDYLRFFRIFSDAFKDTVRNPQNSFKIFSSTQIISVPYRYLQILQNSSKFF